MGYVVDRVTAFYLRAMYEIDEQRGQGLVEYALIIAVVGVMLVGALVALRGGVGNSFNNINTKLANAGN